MDAIGGSGRRVQVCFTVIRDSVSASLPKDSDGEDEHDRVSNKWYDERQYHIRGIGYHAHEEESTAAYRGHHEERRGTLREVGKAT